MWLTVDGERCLRGAEARLLCRAVTAMLSDCVAGIKCDSGSDQGERLYGIDWFDQWDPEQKIWLLEKVTAALLTEQVRLEPAAMWEATVDAIFQHIFEAIVDEIDLGIPPDAGFPGSDPDVQASKADLQMGYPHFGTDTWSWRRNVILALQQQQHRPVRVTGAVEQSKEWRRLVMQVSDRILGVAAYHVVESYRDAEAAKVACFLTQKGLPADFLERIPPGPGGDEINGSALRLHQLLDHVGLGD